MADLSRDLAASSQIRIVRADYANPLHAAALLGMLDAYARDPMGGGEPLSAFAKDHLIQAMAIRPSMFSILAFDGPNDAEAIGLANCIEGFSTFACRPLINVHDLVVSPHHRGRGVGARLLGEIEHIARERGACKLTLEVLSGNVNAVNLYARAGFAQYQLDPAAGAARFMQKWLD